MATFNSSSPHLFAHRGGNAAGRKKENTMAAFKSAVKLGCNFLETDVVVTKDKQVVTYHGSANLFMKSIFGLEIRRKIQNLNYSQVKQSIKVDDEIVPRLQEVLTVLEKQCFSIDVKTDEAVEPLVEVIRKHKAQDRVIITSFSKRRSERANRLLYGENFKGASLCVYRTKGWFMGIFPSLVLSRLKKRGFSYVQIPYRCVTEKLLKVAKEKKVKIYAWTVNDKDKIDELLLMRVDGLISDETKILAEI